MQIFFHSVKSFAKIDASRFKCIISENDQKNCLTPPPSQPLSPSQPVHLFAVERDGLEHTILCSVFLFHGNIFAFINLYFYHFFHIFLYNYTVYFTMSIGYQNDDFQKTRRQKRFTDSITVSVNSSVFVYHACYQV